MKRRILRLMRRNVRIILLLLTSLVCVYWFISQPLNPTSPSPSNYCPRRQHFGNLTNSHFFVFINPKFGDSDVFSNLFFYLGLKYSRYFAVNIEQPKSWTGLSVGRFDDSYIQSTVGTPKIVCQEMDYSPLYMDMLFSGKFVTHQKVVIGFLRNPYEVFMSCLHSHILTRRKENDPNVSMLLETNVNKYMDEFEGDFQEGRSYVGPGSCNNILSYSLGLNDNLFKLQYSLQRDPDAAEKFADIVERRVSDFIIYEHLLQSVFLMKEQYCLDDDMLYLTRIPENYVGIGLGKMTIGTRERVNNFLQYDYTIYNRTVEKFQKEFAEKSLNSEFSREYKEFKKQIVNFTNFCCRKTLSLKTGNNENRAYGLTDVGATNSQCSLISGANVLLAHMVYQIQEYQLTEKVSQVLRGEAKFEEFLFILRDTLEEDEEHVVNQIPM